MKAKIQQIKREGSDIYFVYLPTEIKDRYNLSKGDYIEFIMEKEAIKIRKISKDF
jgi:bifunctional DNA-binding transcriptional regulator/antitoxin component of YhaV-PrlF toxin-antitoxin module